MINFIYDTTFEGFLTAVFDAYESKQKDAVIHPSDFVNPDLFAPEKIVVTDLEKASRVLKGIERKSAKSICLKLYSIFLSENTAKEKLMFAYIKAIIDEGPHITEDYTREYVLAIEQINKKMGREIHRMHAFVRFQKTKQGIFIAMVEPDFNVLPLTYQHFEGRYADQPWIIYDIKRRYGFYYDLKEVNEIRLNYENKDGAGHEELILDDDELLYQDLWKKYFNAVNIPERKNIKLHLRHVPKRYWRLLTEKN